MEHFFDTVQTIEKGVGFKHFGSTHLMWLAICVVLLIAVPVLYKRFDAKRRRVARITVAALLLADEAVKTVCLIIMDGYLPTYLPLHLCSINVLLIAFHVLKPTKTLDNFLYAVCIPATVFALAIPTWTELPLANFMHIHGFTTHLLLILYPVMLTVGGDIRPSVRQLPKTILLLVFLAAAAYGTNTLCEYLYELTGNRLLRTNFMFLRSASDIAPLLFFKKLCGTHLAAFPVIAAVVFVVMYAPVHAIRYLKNRRVVRLQHSDGDTSGIVSR